MIQVRDLVTEGMLGLYFSRRRGIPFAFYFDYPHSEAQLFDLDRLGKRAPLKRMVLRWLILQRNRVLRKVDLVLPISQEAGERIRDRLKVPAERIVLFPVGISRQGYERSGSEISGTVPNLSRSAPTVCYMGNLSPSREPEMIFQILERLLIRLPQTQFLLIGEVTPVARELIAQYSRPEQLFCTGRQPHEALPGLMRNADVGIFPLPTTDPYGIYQTSSPLKVVEYLSCGLPVVSSKVRDAQSLLEASGGGVCVDNDPEEFAAAVVRYLEDPDAARAAGQKGREYVGEHRVFDVLAQQLEAAYQRLLEKQVPAAPDSPLLQVKQSAWVS
jgi:glycosyltransferase involved in cell wall biosynthesis